MGVKKSLWLGAQLYSVFVHIINRLLLLSAYGQGQARLSYGGSLCAVHLDRLHGDGSAVVQNIVTIIFANGVAESDNT